MVYMWHSRLPVPSKSHIDRFLYHCIQRSLLIQNICHSIICYKGTILVELVLTDIFQDFRFQHFILISKTFRFRSAALLPQEYVLYDHH